MKVRCAWCQKSLEPKPPFSSNRLTHGICVECASKFSEGKEVDRGPSPSSDSDRLILIVEEDLETRTALEVALVLSGYAAVSCSNALSARRLLLQIRPAAVLTNQVLPFEDGLSLCRWIHDNPKTAGIPRIVFTYREEPELQRLAALAGCGYFVSGLTTIPSLVEQLSMSIGGQTAQGLDD